MPIYALGDLVPHIDPTAYIHPEAVIIGNVTIAAEASVWPCAVLRGDDGIISVGARSSIQDGCVLHCTAFHPTTVGEGCVVGHIVHLEGCTIEDGSLVGNGSVVLHNAIVRSGALVGSNAVVPNNMEVPSGAMALGVPAKIRPDSVTPQMIEMAMRSYVDRGRVYREALRRID